VPVGDIALEPLRKMWSSVEGFTSSFPGASGVGAVVADAMKRAKDHGELSAAILMGLFEGKVAVVDGRSKRLRRTAQPVLIDYVENEDSIKQDIRATGRELGQHGYHAQLTTGGDSGVFLMQDGRRSNVTADQRERLLHALREDAGNCSPGVIMRNIVQDYVFKPVAVVLGPAEVAYRCQIGGLYNRLQVARPVEFARLTGTLVPPAMKALLEGRSSADLTKLVLDPAGFARNIYRESLAPQVAESATEFKTQIDQATERLQSDIADHISHKAQSRVRSRVADIRKRVEPALEAIRDTGRVAATERWPFLAELHHALRPDGKPQERSLCGLMAFLYGGDGTTGQLLEAAAQHVDDLLDGAARHIVYSARQ
jgi:uncharacterized protein YllA (UPF0747 family)